jgi:hypothetical protein
MKTHVSLRDLEGRHVFGGIEVDHFHQREDDPGNFSTVVRLELDGQTYVVEDEHAPHVSISDEPITNRNPRQVSIEYWNDDYEDRVLIIDKTPGRQGEEKVLGVLHIHREGPPLITLGGELAKEAHERMKQLKNLFPDPDESNWEESL